MTPAPVVISAAGTVVARMLLIEAAQPSVPAEFAYASDPGGEYSVGSVYTPSKA
ncbi:hypothetical protein AA0522_1799 [Gluconacetobacter liquefaciens NRIC 0522]|nr:hypothetical protein AA0522_1799 [Gluconacetobacter liquefaciens NRIC 0522]